MNSSLDYLVRPALIDESNVRLQHRLNQRQFSAWVRFAETHGHLAIWGGSLDSRLVRRDVAVAARALRQGLEANRDKLTTEDFEALVALVRFLERPAAADGVVITRALPNAEGDKPVASAHDIKNAQAARFFVRHKTPKSDGPGSERVACRREPCGSAT